MKVQLYSDQRVYRITLNQKIPVLLKSLNCDHDESPCSPYQKFIVKMVLVKMCTKTIFLLFSIILLYVHSLTDVKVGVLLMTSAEEPFDLRRVGPALDIAFELSESRYGIRFTPIYHNYTGFCPKETVIGHLSELHYVHKVNAVIGPACSATLVAAGRLAQYLNIPIVSGVGDLIIRDVLDKDMYTTFTRTSYNLGKLSSKIYPCIPNLINNISDVEFIVNAITKMNFLFELSFLYL